MPRKPTSAVDEAFDELYAIEPSAFVSRRNALAAERKAAGDDAGAAAIKAALKPTVSAAIVNQLVRAKPALVDELMAATTEVVRAQLGSKGRTYQEALADRRAMEQRVNDELHALGGNETVVHRAMASLRAGSLTAETRDLIRAGHLSKDLEMPDVDVLLEGLPTPKPRPARAAKIDRRAEEREAERQKQEQLRVARAHVVETKQVLDAARTRLRAAQRELAAAEKEVAAAEEAHTEARTQRASAGQGRAAVGPPRVS
jgi:hypothetical protein